MAEKKNEISPRATAVIVRYNVEQHKNELLLSRKMYIQLTLYYVLSMLYPK